MKCKKHFPQLSHIDNTKSNSQLREANLLALDVTKSRVELGIDSILNFDETIDYTCEWYKNFIGGNDPKVLCMNQISDFLSKIKQNQK